MKIRFSGIHIVLLVSVAAIVAWATPRHPLYQEWRLSHLPLEQLEAECKDVTDDYRLLYYTGLRLNERKRYSEALPLLLQATRLCPDEARIRDAMAQSQMPLGKTGEAFNQLAQFVGTHPDSAEGHLNLGKFYLAMKSGTRAQTELERAVSLNQNLAEGWSALAETRSEFSPDKSAAVEAARRAAQLRPENAEDHLFLAGLLVDQAAPNARREFERALKIAPDRADICRRYADFLLSTGDKADQAYAETEARRAIALDSTAPQAYLVLGRALMRRGADAEAVDPLKRATTLDPYASAPARELLNLSHRLQHPVEARHWEAIWRQRQDYLLARQLELDEALAHPNDRSRSRRLAALLGYHGEVLEALRYQGLAQGKLSDAPSVLIQTANDLTAGSYSNRALPLAQRALEITDDPSLLKAANQTLRSIQAHLPKQ